jgi:drug/metabolite transporter (DMT)-like permease
MINSAKARLYSFSHGELAQIAMVALIAGATVIAFSPIFVRLSQAGPTATAFWRLTLALPAMWLWTRFDRSEKKLVHTGRSGADRWWLVAAGFCFAGDLAAFHWSVKLTVITNSIFLANLSPVFVTLGAWFLFRHKVTGVFIIGMVIAIMGAAILIGFSFKLSFLNLLGDALGAVTAIFYGSYFLCVKQLSRNFSTATIMFWSGVVAVFVLFPIVLLSGETMLPVNLWGWMIFLGLALLSHVGGQGLVAYSLTYLSASLVAVTLLLQPVLSTVFAWLILYEAISPWQILGGLVVLTGIYVARRGSQIG